MKKFGFGLGIVAVLFALVFAFSPTVVAQQDPWWRPLSPFGSSAGVTYGTLAPSLATTGQNPAQGEIWVDTDGANDGGGMINIWNYVAAAWQPAGMQMASTIIFEGATADAFELVLTAADVGQDQVYYMGDYGEASVSFVTSLLDTMDIDEANSVHFTATGGLVAEGATADAFEVTIAADDPTVDATYTFSDKSVTGSFDVIDAGRQSAFAIEVPDREDRVTAHEAPRYKAWFRTMPVYTVDDPTTAGALAACDTTGNPNWIIGPSIVGYGFELDAKGTQTVCGNDYAAADGMGLHTDATTNEGFELTQGIVDGSPGAFTIGTSPAFYGRVRWAIGTVANTDQSSFGFRLVQAYDDAVIGNYTDSYTIGVGDRADGGAGDWYNDTLLNGAGAVATDMAEADWTDNQVHTVEIRVSAAGVVTTWVEGVLCGDCPAFTFDDTDVVVPYFWTIADVTGANPDIDVVYWEVGLQ